MAAFIVGDPVTFMLGQDATQADRERMTRLLGMTVDLLYYGVDPRLRMQPV